MKNILFATVRQGNCGDEFILFGTQNIIRTLQSEYNPVIVNKNVEVCRRLQFKNKIVDIGIDTVPPRKINLNLSDLCFKNLPLEDNSFADYYDLNDIDAVVFAGTPEWLVYKLFPLYQKLETYKGPILFLGVGYHEGFGGPEAYLQFHETYRKIHKKALVFAVRDNILLNYLKPEVQAVLLPCPAIFCSKRHRKRDRLTRIGFSLQAKAGDARVNFVSQAVYDFSFRLLNEVSKHYETEVIAHWIEDLIYLKREVKSDLPVRYSYDAKDYLGLYDRYDLVISTRVHGSGMAASLGIPTMTISHSMRTDTVKGFLSHVLSPAQDIMEILNLIRSLDMAAESEKIIRHKEATRVAYQELLKPIFPL
ncbi:MAG: polysaccharide pyruvyl transferase family protein [Desulfobacteraceae bacterium]|nr:MAG: polysaccharide pyruvyl transferase family protein [Desulfobacteraceae bacterium]